LCGCIDDVGRRWPASTRCTPSGTNVDYTVVDGALIRLGALSVPVRAGTPVARLRPIVAQTEQCVTAAGIAFPLGAVHSLNETAAAARRHTT
jgi:fatty acid CoA ligase FadD9